MSPKTKRVLSTVFLAIPVIVLMIGGVSKIIDAEPEMVMQFLTKAGFGPYIILLGLSELIIAALLIYPKTTKTGFLLATAYFGGALSLEISGHQPTASVVFLAMLWASMFLRDKGMFVS